MTISAMIQRLGRFPGSTRSVSLMRLGLPPIIWTRWGSDWLFYQHLDWPRMFLSAAFFLFSVMMFMGCWSRLSSAATGICLLVFYYWIGLHLGREPYTHHHTYILAIAPCLLAMTPCGGSYSWDRWRKVLRAERTGQPIPEEAGDLWAMRLIAVQLSMIYFWAGYAKSTVPYLSGERMEQYMMYLYFGSDYPEFPGFHAIAIFLAWSSMVLEYVLAVALLLRRWQRSLVPVALVFHAVIYWTLPVGTFSITMAILFLAWLDPSTVHQWIDRISGVKNQGTTS